ncbi:MAG: flagellar M-ring protein FliF [Pseudomonadota bacterium]|nr:flagellar M-ring protein FliF [Pseudomonadota bacterium]
MDTAIALPAPLPSLIPATFAGRFKAMPARTKMTFAIGLAALVAVVVALSMNARDGDYKVLYANLSDKDGGAVIAQLAQMNVPYKVTPGNGAILVPTSMVPDLKLKMATAGLPKGTTSGYELMDNARFGQTSFQERLNFQRGLEGELTRSITSLAAVQSARVHLALPNQNGFFREQQKAAASVLLGLHPGRTIDRSQVAGIVHLVASSVPELDPKAVSVVDQTGTLLTGEGGNQPAGLDAQQLSYLSQVETGYAKRIVELVEPIVGRNNLRATVAADVDFSQSEATSEEFKPNQGTQATMSIRSQQTSDASGSAGGALPSGVPGAASNQPPTAATAPLSGASQPLQGAPLSGTGSSGGRREAVTNYEVDKTVRVTKNASGAVKRLNAAVVVNHRSVTDAKGKTTQVALLPDELEKITALVKESIGFRQDRGDSVKVVNAPFRVETMALVETPWWKQPEIFDLLRAVALPLALAAVAWLVFFGLIRPGVRTVFVATTPVAALPGSARGDAPAAELQVLQALEAPPPPPAEVQLEQARQMAKDNPAAVAGILREWVGREQQPAPTKR